MRGKYRIKNLDSGSVADRRVAIYRREKSPKVGTLHTHG